LPLLRKTWRALWRNANRASQASSDGSPGAEL